MKTWLQENGTVIGALAGVIVAFVTVLQLAVVGPMNRGFDNVNRGFDNVNQRFDDLRAEMNQRFDQQDKYMNARFDAMDERIGAVEQRLDRLTDEVSEMRVLVTGVGERVSRNEGQIEVIREQLQTVDAPEP